MALQPLWHYLQFVAATSWHCSQFMALHPIYGIKALNGIAPACVLFYQCFFSETVTAML
jgi:hypothetical protein